MFIGTRLLFILYTWIRSCSIFVCMGLYANFRPPQLFSTHTTHQTREALIMSLLARATKHTLSDPTRMIQRVSLNRRRWKCPYLPTRAKPSMQLQSPTPRKERAPLVTLSSWILRGGQSGHRSRTGVRELEHDAGAGRHGREQREGRAKAEKYREPPRLTTLYTHPWGQRFGVHNLCIFLKNHIYKFLKKLNFFYDVTSNVSHKHANFQLEKGIVFPYTKMTVFLLEILCSLEY
jgi:hypothetical protein